MRMTTPMLGKTFGELTVIARGNNVGKETAWICRCSCDNITQPIIGMNLRKGHTKSCGCLRTKHNAYHTRLYEVWHSMKQRCNNPKNQAFPNYGGRGICVCNEWSNSFATFRDWAM